eukprot:PhM_4_TR11614/c5_g1_i1/m.9796
MPGASNARVTAFPAKGPPMAKRISDSCVSIQSETAPRHVRMWLLSYTAERGVIRRGDLALFKRAPPSLPCWRGVRFSPTRMPSPRALRLRLALAPTSRCWMLCTSHFFINPLNKSTNLFTAFTSCVLCLYRNSSFASAPCSASRTASSDASSSPMRTGSSPATSTTLTSAGGLSARRSRSSSMFVSAALYFSRNLFARAVASRTSDSSAAMASVWSWLVASAASSCWLSICTCVALTFVDRRRPAVPPTIDVCLDSGEALATDPRRGDDDGERPAPTMDTCFSMEALDVLLLLLLSEAKIDGDVLLNDSR